MPWLGRIVDGSALKQFKEDAVMKVIMENKEKTEKLYDFGKLPMEKQHERCYNGFKRT